MRTPNKSRSRNKNRRNSGNNIGNIVNRVFDSNGPEGRVRGTPNQIIEKYEALARDMMLSGDRVMAENFAQHAEHYIRLLAEAKTEIEKALAAKQIEEEQRQQQDAESEAENSQIAQTEGSEVSESPEQLIPEKEKQSRKKHRRSQKGFETPEDIPEFLNAIGDEVPN